MQLNTITELLNIPNYKVTHMIRNTSDRLHVMLDQMEATPAVCSGCGNIHHDSVHSRGFIVVEDLRISGKREFLHVPKRRTCCIEDGAIRVEEIDWLSGRFTKRFAEEVYRLTAITTNQEAGCGTWASMMKPSSGLTGRCWKTVPWRGSIPFPLRPI